MGVPALLEAMRPHQWVKNGFVIAPLLFARRGDDLSMVGNSVLAFAAFALASSGIYLINDVLDRDRDRLHPKKRTRPVASGRLSVSTSLIAATALILVAVAASGGINWGVAATVGAYVVLQLAYVLVLKHLVIIDVMTVAVGFVLRVLAGAAAVEVVASEWLILCTLLLALFLGFSKRRHELVTLGGESGGHRKVLNDYNAALLDQINSVLLGATIVCYAIYTVSPRTKGEVSEHLVYSVLFVIYGLLRYLFIVHRGSHAGSPTDALLRDRGLLLCVVGWATYCAVVIYGG